MTRWILLQLAVSACSLGAEQPTDITVTVLGEDAHGVLPFRTGGPFAVRVTATHAAQLGRSSHAAVDIVTPMAVTGAVTSTTIALTDQGDGTLAGTAPLAWPPGDPVMVRAQVADAVCLQPVPFEPHESMIHPLAFTDTGAQIEGAYCIDSPSTDGTLAVHLEGAVLKDTRVPDGTVALVPGACNGDPLDVANPSSHVRITVIPSGTTFRIYATLAGTGASPLLQDDVPDFGPFTLTAIPSTSNPTGLSIVDVDVHAELGGRKAKGISLIFQSVPATTIVPAAASTNSDGNASATFQMPEKGPLRLFISAGSDTSQITFP